MILSLWQDKLVPIIPHKNMSPICLPILDVFCSFQLCQCADAYVELSKENVFKIQLLLLLLENKTKLTGRLIN